MNLLLISTGRIYGYDFLEYLDEPLNEWSKDASNILFVPWASDDHDSFLELVNNAFTKITGKRVIGAHTLNFQNNELDNFSHIFIGGGNSFRLLNSLYESGIRDSIMKRVANGSIAYMGSSAGSNMACPTLKTTNDMPIIQPPSFDALNIVPFQINPHYFDADQNSTHQGETREQRITEYLQENDTPVIGLPEGAWIQGDYGKSLEIAGNIDSKLFTKSETRVLKSGESLDFLLNN